MKLTINYIIIILLFIIILKKNKKKEYFITEETNLICIVDINICKNDEESKLCQDIKIKYNFDELPEDEINFCSKY